MRKTFLLLMLAFLLACVPACSSSTAETRELGSRPTPALDYVALGDSFTAGPLITAPVDDSPARCARSSANYPRFLASYLKVTAFTDVSCSGATTHDLGQGRAGVPPQLAALSRSTDLVTLGIGGNDFGLFATMLGAARSAAVAPNAMRDAAAVRPHIESAIAAIRSRAPKARIVVVGYLRVLPESGTCPLLPGPSAALRAADSIERALNGSIQQASRNAGALFIDAYALSKGHDICAGQEAWVNGSMTDVSRAAPFHPFRAGMDAVARAIFSRVNTGPIPRTPSAATLLRVPR